MENQVVEPIYDVLGMKIKNPIIVGSGLLSDQAKNIRQFIAHGAGAVVTKTIYPRSEKLHIEKTYLFNTGMLNNTTYSKKSVDYWLTLLREFKEEQLPVIVSIHAESPEALASLAVRISEVTDAPLELGISCLHADDFTEDTPERVFNYTKAVKERTDTPFSVKLSLGDNLYGRVQAAVEGGADAITLSDTISGIAFDTANGEALLNGVCGYSGPGIKPMVLAAIYNLRKRGVTIPILGSGGVQDGNDVHEYMLAGANTVQVYTALHRHMYKTLQRIVHEYTQIKTSEKV
ncbi:dihydroorotate dehydrogenase [Photorhabdus sp. P32]|uniref:dihydroorotate dehydrogenase n=1 Tax=Photorhabdus sp. P32 TaxID=3117549 RepID=UPI00311B03C9